MKLQCAVWVLLHSSAASANPLKRQAAKPQVESAALQALITEENLLRHAAAFQDIATANGGNRAFARPGYDASVQYVKDQMAKLDGMKTWTQDFDVSLGNVWVGKMELAGAAVEAFGTYYTPSTPEGGLTAPLVLGPTGTAACDAAGYANLDVRGKIVLVERGNCPGYYAGYLERRMMPAAAAGAAGVLIYSDVRSLNGGGFSRSAKRGDVPTVCLSQTTGKDLVRRLGAGERLTPTITAGHYNDLRKTQNVFVETTGGDASQTLILGAHLDSVDDGPGINDNGSGCSLLLELARALSRFGTQYRVRFAFWGAEERGMLGSTHYVDSLGAAGARDVMAYLNFDMVGRGFFGVFDGDGSAFGATGPPGSAAVQRLLAGALAAGGRVVTPAPLTNRTDYAAFFRAGRPVGGLTTGSSEDNCYHRACDTLQNVDAPTMAAHAKAAAHALSVLAVKGLDS